MEQFEAAMEKTNERILNCGQVFNKMNVKIDAVARTFKPIWRSRNGFSIKNLGEHKHLFIFNNKSNVDRVLRQEPWSFDKHLVVLQQFCKDTPLEDLKLQESSFWIQVHNIPLSYMDRETIKEICAVAGRVVCTTGDAKSGGGRLH